MEFDNATIVVNAPAFDRDIAFLALLIEFPMLDATYSIQLILQMEERSIFDNE